MVKNRHHESGSIPEVTFAAPAGTPTGVEVLSLAQLRSRARDGALSRPQRPAFHHLVTVSRGLLWHTVDFTGYTVEPGSWLWVRPGQVQQWHDLRHVDGMLILFEADFLDPATADAVGLGDPHAPVVQTADDDERAALQRAALHLHEEFYDRGIPSEARVAVLRHLLAVLILRLRYLGRTVGSPAADHSLAFLSFRDAVERDFTRVRRVEDYARLLGYSPRTLSRATLAAAGVGAKEFVDRRVILEAKRLLAHSERSAAQIAGELGFPDPTNFSKYFHHRTGTTPIAFRADVRGTPS